MSDLHRSQSGQDAFVSTYIKERDGVFFEAGAWDGEELSNTYYLERACGWMGVLVEPMRRFFPAMHQKRPNAICVNAGISGNERRKVLYLEAGDRSGILKWMDRKSIQFIEDLYASHPQDVRIDWVDIIPVMTVLEEARVSHIDYFSLDTEGGEIDILRALDFSRISVDLFGVEDNFLGGREIEAFLAPFGYLRLGHLGPDYFFIRRPVLENLAAERGAKHVETIYRLLA